MTIKLIFMKLTKTYLIKEGENFCKHTSSINHPKLMGINDGKSIGTYIEHEFKKYLSKKYEFNIGSSSLSIDFPDEHINTDLKVTSIHKPQNSCPFKSIYQKIYGLGYNILLFVYEKIEKNGKCYLTFDSCTFIPSYETGDYNLTKDLLKLLKNNSKKNKIKQYLLESNLPLEEEILNNLIDEIINNPPKQSYLTISNAFQWRLRYNYVKKETHKPYQKKNL